MAVTKDIPITGPVPAAVLDKYKSAGAIVDKTLQHLITKAVAGANLLELCAEGDKLVEEATALLYNKKVDGKLLSKGIAFPTCLSLNATIQNYSPLPSDAVGSATLLAANDILKITLGAHFDGYAVISAETIVVSPSALPIVDVRADLIAAVNQAAEIALRKVMPGARNWEVTESIKELFKEYESVGVKGIEGILSHQHEQNSIEAKKGIVATPSIQQRADGDNAFTFDEGEVYGLNILVTNGEKVVPKSASVTTIYQKTTSQYALKMKTSRATFSEVSKKAGSFPFVLRVLDDEKKAKFGITECSQHGLLKGFEVITCDKPTELSAQAFITFAVSKTGAVRLSPSPTFFKPENVKSTVEIKNEELKALLARPLKIKAVKEKKKEVEVKA